MKKICAISVAIVSLSSMSIFAGPPTSAKASYEMYRNNLLFAHVEETFTVENGKYKIESEANPDGLLKVISRDRITRVSRGDVTEHGLQPEFYEEKRTSGDKEKIKTARLDWKTHKIALSFDGKTETADLPKETQDWASLFYQFLFSPPPKKDSIKATVTDGKRVESYAYRFADEENVTTAAGKFDTLHYVYNDDKGERKTEIWLAKQKSFFPVRLIQEEGGNVLEQRLVALTLH